MALMNSNENEEDFGIRLSEKSIEAFESGDYLKAFLLQVEPIDDAVKVMIAGRAKHLGINEEEIKKLAYKGTFEKRIDNFIKLCGNDFKYFCENLHDYRERRNRITHEKASFKDEEEINRFAMESWLMGTEIIYNFINSIENYPYLKNLCYNSLPKIKKVKS